MRVDIIRAFVLAVFVAAVTACTGTATTRSPIPGVTAPATSAPSALTSPAASAITVRDDAGRIVTLAAPPARIVSAAPSTTELAFAVGLGDEVVAVDEFSNYPPEASSRTSIGSYIEPDLETIIGARPDLVLVTDVHLAELVPALDEQGIPTLVLSARNIEGVLLNLLLLGQLVGDDTEAERVVADLRARIAAVDARVAGRDLVSVFYELDPSLFTAGPGSFIDDVIRRAGGRNIAATAGEAFPQLSAEEVIQSDPTVILLADEVAGVTPDAVASRAGWTTVSAVESGRIVVIDPDIGSRPGPRVVDALEVIAAALHPED
ncbi:MAG: ABC transporter substrate-binding protein [Thermoleophilaceae bacterium]